MHSLKEVQRLCGIQWRLYWGSVVVIEVVCRLYKGCLKFVLRLCGVVWPDVPGFRGQSPFSVSSVWGFYAESEPKMSPDFCLRNMVTLVWRLYSGCVEVVQRLYRGCAEVVRRLCGGCTEVVQRLYRGCVEVIQRLCWGYIEVVWRLYGGCVEVVRRLYGGCVEVVRRLCGGCIMSGFYWGSNIWILYWFCVYVKLRFGTTVGAVLLLEVLRGPWGRLALDQPCVPGVMVCLWYPSGNTTVTLACGKKTASTAE